MKEVHPEKIVLNDGTDVPYGLLVWSTGVGPSQFVKTLNLPKSPGGRYPASFFFLFFLFVSLRRERNILPISSFPYLCIDYGLH